MLLIGVETCNCYDRFVLYRAELDKTSRERVNPQLVDVGINTGYVTSNRQRMYYIN